MVDTAITGALTLTVDKAPAALQVPHRLFRSRLEIVAIGIAQFRWHRVLADEEIVDQPGAGTIGRARPLLETQLDRLTFVGAQVDGLMGVTGKVVPIAVTADLDPVATVRGAYQDVHVVAVKQIQVVPVTQHRAYRVDRNGDLAVEGGSLSTILVVALVDKAGIIVQVVDTAITGALTLTVDKAPAALQVPHRLFRSRLEIVAIGIAQFRWHRVLADEEIVDQPGAGTIGRARPLLETQLDRLTFVGAQVDGLMGVTGKVVPIAVTADLDPVAAV